MTFKHTLTASAIMMLTMVCLTYLSHGENIRPNKPLSTFPKKIGEWVGEERRFDKKVYDILGVDDSFLSNYRTPDGRPVNLYIGFYQSQRQGDLIHSPKNCMPGAGWNVIETSKAYLIHENIDAAKKQISKLLLQNGAQKQVMFYWFQSRGRIISSEYMQKIYLVIDSITRHRTDGSFVRLMAPVINHDEAMAEKSLEDFAKILFPILKEYIPS
jgi:EpsI family protein